MILSLTSPLFRSRCHPLRGLRALPTALAAMAALSLPAAAGTVEADIEAAEESRYGAMIAKDRPALDRALGDELVYHQPTGLAVGKGAYLDQVMGPNVQFRRARRYDVATHVYGDVATVTGATQVELSLEGAPRQFDIRFLNVWVHRDGRWQLVARQSAFKSPPK